MRRLPRPLLLLHGDPAFRALMVDAGSPGYVVSPLSGWDVLRRAAGRASPAAVAVVDPYAGGGGDGLAPALFSLIRDFPSLPVVPAFDVAPERAGDLRALAGAGAAGIIRVGEESRATVRQALRAVQRRAVRRLLDRALPGSSHGRVRALLEAAATVAVVGGTAADLAAACGTSERTVLRWCVAGSLPPPRRLLAWLRVLVAASLLDEPGRTVGSVARVCGYSFDGALRKAVKSMVGVGAGELRGQGAFATAARAFAAELSGLREARPPWAAPG